VAKNIQIRNVPEALHRRLKVKAASEGRTLSAYLLHELERLAELPSEREIRARLAKIVREEMSPSAAELIREDRDNR
jgi:plasmid stability protein